MLYIIVTGGPLPDQAAGVIRSLSGSTEDSVIIGCDSAADFLAKLNIVPDLIVGDMDSVTDEGLEFIKSNNIFVETYPVEKDWTDTEIALGKADDGDIVLICPLAGRLDHVMANIGIVLKMKTEGRNIYITDGDTYCYPLCGEDGITADVTRYNGNAAVSLIPCDFSSPVKGVTTRDLYYALENAELTYGSSFSFSNHPDPESTDITVSIREGLLLVVTTFAI